MRNVFREPGLWLLMGVMGLRLGLAAYAGPGRDELAYWYWGWHALDAAYSWVTVSAIRLSTALFGDSPLAMRLPTITAAIAAVAVMVRLARRLGVTPRGATWIALAFAVSPWQMYAGTVVHPDAFFVLFVLLLAERMVALEGGATARALLGAAAAAGLAALTKLTGAVLLPVALWWAWRHRRSAPWAAVGAAALVASAGGALLLSRDPQVLAGLREFGRFAPGAGLVERLGMLLGEIVLFGGPALALGAGIGIRRSLREGGLAGPQAPVLAIAAVLLALHVAFGLAGQAKGNWFLPALTLLLPLCVSATAGRPRGGLPRGLVGAIVATLAISIAGATAGVAILRAGNAGSSRTATPGMPASAGPSGFLTRLDSSYATHVGEREAAVSPTRRWSERLAEYRRDPLLPRRPVIDGPPLRILSNDYGTAFAVAHAWGRDAEVLLPWDPVCRGARGRPPERGEDFLFVSRSSSGPPPETAARFTDIHPVPLEGRRNDPSLVVFHCRAWASRPAGDMAD